VNVLVVGGLGNMGRRYCAILKHLGHTPLPVDIDTSWPRAGYDHAIIATPTGLHALSVVEVMKKRGRYHLGEGAMHILCEKPVLTDLEALKKMYAWVEAEGGHLCCVNQYQYLLDMDYALMTKGDSWYSYYNSGRDGIHWDCFQIYALAGGKVTVDNESPFWSCGINGTLIRPGYMDQAYVEMIRDFLGEKKNTWGKDIVLKATQKILEAMKCAKS
jgi:hypothetical protein